MYTNEKIEVQSNGEIIVRDHSDGRRRKADKRRDQIAAKLNAKYIGVKKIVSKKLNKPVTYEYILLALKNGTVLEMTKPAFENKHKVNAGKKKKNSFAELVISAYLEKHGIPFMREARIAGFTFSERYQELKDTLSEEENKTLDEVSRSIMDFIIFPNEKDEPTKLMPINGSFHNTKYDASWAKFTETGLAAKLGFVCEAIDTSSFKSTKNDPKAVEYILKEVSDVLGIPFDYSFMEEYSEILNKKEAINAIQLQTSAIARQFITELQAYGLDYAEIVANEMKKMSRKH